MRKVCIITGATSGIGFELAKIFSKEDIDLLLISSNLKNLENTKNTLSNNKANIDILKIDLSKKFDTKVIEDKLLDKKLYCLINNAGFGELGEFIDTDIEKMGKMVDLNIKALMNLSYFFLNVTKGTRENVYLLNVASVAAFMSGPLMSVYYATKSFVLSFTRAINYEIAKKNQFIKISCLCPGPTRTNFTVNFIKKPNVFKNFFSMDAKSVADIAYKNLFKGKKIIITGKINYLMIKTLNFLPNSLIEYFTYKIMK